MKECSGEISVGQGVGVGHESFRLVGIGEIGT